jgi:hypothetical protein
LLLRVFKRKRRSAFHHHGVVVVVGGGGRRSHRGREKRSVLSDEEEEEVEKWRSTAVATKIQYCTVGPLVVVLASHGGKSNDEVSDDANENSLVRRLE